MMATNERVYLMISIPIRWNALLFARGIAFIEKRSDAMDKRLATARDRRRAGGRH
jgi:hypothetical protein